MCVVSNIGDMGRGMWPKPWGDGYTPSKPSFPYNPIPAGIPGIYPPPVDDHKTYPVPGHLTIKPYNGPTKEQFEEFLKLMRQAKKLDEALGAADCESAAKVKWLKELADYLGCDVSDLVK